MSSISVNRYDAPSNFHTVRQGFTHTPDPSHGYTDQYIQTQRAKAKFMIETKEGSIFVEAKQEGDRFVPVTERIKDESDPENAPLFEKQDKTFTYVHDLESNDVAVMHALEFVPGYADPADVGAMRASTRRWFDEAVSQNTFSAAFFSETPGAVCHLALSEEPRTFRDRHMVLAPWQTVASRHIAAFCRAPAPAGAVFLNHGTGSGKSATFGIAAIQLATLNDISRNLPNKPSHKDIPASERFGIFLLLPSKANNLGESPEQSAMMPLFDDMVSVLGVDSPNMTKQQKRAAFVSWINQNTGCNTSVYEFRSGNTYASRMRMENVHPFGLESAQADAQKSFIKYLEKITRDVLSKKYRPKKYAVFVDEAHAFFDSDWRTKQLMDMRDAIVGADGTEAVKFVFSSATPFNSAEAETRFNKFIAYVTTGTEGASENFWKTKGAIHWSMTYLDRLPLGARAAVCPRKIPGDTPMLEDAYAGVAVARSDKKNAAPLFSIVGDQTAAGKFLCRSLARIYKALEHFYISCERAPDCYPKCVVLIPSVTVKVNGRDESFFDVFRDVFAYGSQDLWNAFTYESTTSKKHQTRFYSPKAGASALPPDTHRAVFGQTSYASFGQVDGTLVFGTSESLRAKTHDERRAELGLVKDTPPTADIIFVDHKSTGVDLQGVTLEYVVQKPDTDGEYQQLIGRGIRFCSLSGMADDNFKTNVYCIDFDPPPPASNATIFDDRIIDKDLYEGPRVDECSIAEADLQRKLARHNNATAELERINIESVQNQTPAPERTRLTYAIGLYTIKTSGELQTFLAGKDPTATKYRNLVKMLKEVHPDEEKSKWPWSRLVRFGPPTKRGRQDVAEESREKFVDIVEAILDIASGEWTAAAPNPVKVNIENIQVLKDFVNDRSNLDRMVKRIEDEVWVTQKDPNANKPIIPYDDTVLLQWLPEGVPDLKLAAQQTGWYAVPLTGQATCVRSEWKKMQPLDVVIVPFHPKFEKLIAGVRGEDTAFGIRDVHFEEVFRDAHVNEAAGRYLECVKVDQVSKIREFEKLLAKAEWRKGITDFCVSNTDKLLKSGAKGAGADVAKVLDFMQNTPKAFAKKLQSSANLLSDLTSTASGKEVARGILALTSQDQELEEILEMIAQDRSRAQSVDIFARIAAYLNSLTDDAVRGTNALVIRNMLTQ